MYGDTVSKAMRTAIDETERRRRIQSEYNEAHGIVPKSVSKGVREVIEATKAAEDMEGYDEFLAGRSPLELTKKELKDYVNKLEKEMRQAAADMQFERAAELRDLMFEYKARM